APPGRAGGGGAGGEPGRGGERHERGARRQRDRHRRARRARRAGVREGRGVGQRRAELDRVRGGGGGDRQVRPVADGDRDGGRLVAGLGVGGGGGGPRRQEHAGAVGQRRVGADLDPERRRAGRERVLAGLGGGGRAREREGLSA